MKSALHALCSLISIVVVVLFVVMTSVMFSLVITRYVFLWSAPWAEEATRYAMVWLVMMGSAMLALFDDHIALNLVSERLTGRALIAQKTLSQLVVIGSMSVVAWIGYGFSLSMTRVIAAGTGWPMAIPTFAIPLGATLIAVFALLRLIADLLPSENKLQDTVPGQFTYMDSSFRASDETRQEIL